MSPLQVAALSTALAGGGVAALTHGLRRAPRSFAQVRAAMYGAAAGGGSPRTPTSEGWIHSTAGRSATSGVAGRLGPGLLATGLTPADVVTRLVVAASLGFVTVMLSVSALVVSGSLPFSPLWVVLALLVGGAAVTVMWSDVRTKVRRARRELLHAVNDFVQLVAVGLTTDQSIEEAVRFALDAGGEGPFDLIRREIEAAPLRGIPLWEAVRGLALTHDVRELHELAGAIERQGLQGVSIAASVSGLAAAMRAASLDALEREADRANANLTGPTIGFVVATLVFLAYPLALRVTEAFGG